MFYKGHFGKQQKNDDYYSPRSVWEDVIDYIPKDKIIWEPFYGNGSAGQFLRDLDVHVIHEQIDFFDNNLGAVLVSNPPFSIKKQVFKRLKLLGKPFMMLVPCNTVHTGYFHKIFEDRSEIQFIIPSKRIHFLKHVDGCIPEGWKNHSNFDTTWVCWKMNFDKDITWL